MRKEFKVNILGADYDVLIAEREELNNLSNNSVGQCDLLDKKYL